MTTGFYGAIYLQNPLVNLVRVLICYILTEFITKSVCRDRFTHEMQSVRKYLFMQLVDPLQGNHKWILLI